MVAPETKGKETPPCLTQIQEQPSILESRTAGAQPGAYKVTEIPFDKPAIREPERNHTMHTITEYDAITSRFHQLSDELSAGCDSDFDVAYDDLDREFQELRLLVAPYDGR